MAGINRHHLIELAVIGVSSGAAAGGGGILIRYGFDKGDVLAFLGALLGAAAAVAGAAWLTEFNASRESRREHGLILAELVDLRDAGEGARASIPGDTVPEAWPANRNDLTDSARRAERFLAEVIAKERTLNFEQRFLVKDVAEAVRSYLCFHHDVFSGRSDEEEAMDERSWEGEIGYLLDHTNEAIDALRGAGPSRS